MRSPRALLIDYGIGNLFSIERAVRHIGGSVEISDSANKVSFAERIILPGVGAFANAMDELKRKGLIDSIYDFVQKERPLLGICLGMQLLMSESEEFNSCRGLNLVSGKVERLLDKTDDGGQLKIPHIGWNTLHIPGFRGSSLSNGYNERK